MIKMLSKVIATTFVCLCQEIMIKKQNFIKMNFKTQTGKKSEMILIDGGKQLNNFKSIGNLGKKGHILVYSITNRA